LEDVELSPPPFAVPKKNCTFVTGEHSSKELFEQLMLLLIGTSTVLTYSLKKPKFTLILKYQKPACIKREYQMIFSTKIKK
jgi:hypothetical protein